MRSVERRLETCPGPGSTQHLLNQVNNPPGPRSGLLRSNPACHNIPGVPLGSYNGRLTGDVEGRVLVCFRA
jgi:hypothetical protein